MRVRVNDAEFELPDGATVSGLLERLQLAGSRVAVEVNQGIVRRAEHAARTLNEGDRVEVVTLVGGG